MNANQLKLILLLALFVGGCATGTLNTNTAQDVGSAPVNYESTIRAYLRETLKDPFSIQDFSVEAPVLARCSIGIYGPFHGWAVRTHYNAKNSYGAYVGRKTYYYWFHGEGLKGENDSLTSCNLASGWKGAWTPKR